MITSYHHCDSEISYVVPIEHIISSHLSIYFLHFFPFFSLIFPCLSVKMVPLRLKIKESTYVSAVCTALEL